MVWPRVSWSLISTELHSDFLLVRWCVCVHRLGAEGAFCSTGLTLDAPRSSQGDLVATCPSGRSRTHGYSRAVCQELRGECFRGTLDHDPSPSGSYLDLQTSCQHTITKCIVGSAWSAPRILLIAQLLTASAHATKYFGYIPWESLGFGLARPSPSAGKI